jgi:hypothetical protein
MDEIAAGWRGLGLAFEHPPMSKVVDPEKLIIDSLIYFYEDRKLVGLIFVWLKNYGDLIHVERLKALSKYISAEESIWLGALASFSYTFDRRWGVLLKKCISKKKSNFSISDFDTLQAERLGADPYFAEVGIKIPVISWQDKQRKLLTRQYIIEHHFWIRLRVLFGVNWRADIAWEMVRDSNQTPYQVAKRLGCNMETAYRNWKALHEANALSLLVA